VRLEYIAFKYTRSPVMDVSGIVVQPVGERNFEASVQFLMDWVSDGGDRGANVSGRSCRTRGVGLVATRGHDVVGYAAILWESDFAGFRDRGIPLIHQVAVAGPFRRQGVAALLRDRAEQLARERGIATLGITVGLSGEYGPAQRLYGQRGYCPGGRGACRGQRPVSKGMPVTMDDDLIVWLTKDLVS
jgi:GNAT superfamily N-acetyltransferase